MRRLDSSFPVGRFNCLGGWSSLVGDRLTPAVDDLLTSIGRKPVDRLSPSRARETLVQAISPIPHGAVLRILGRKRHESGRPVFCAARFLF